MLKHVAAVVAGFIAASVVMMAFEFANSLAFPLPAGMDKMDLAAVRAFAHTLPWYAYLPVIAGWACGSLVAGLVAARIAPASWPLLPAVLGLLLTAAGVGNTLMLEHPLWVNVVGLPLFLLLPLVSYRLRTILWRKANP